VAVTQEAASRCEKKGSEHPQIDDCAEEGRVIRRAVPVHGRAYEEAPRPESGTELDSDGRGVVDVSQERLEREAVGV
jgi:hypothetical protein